jgi:hypothetical protein
MQAAAAAALSDKQVRQTNIAAAVDSCAKQPPSAAAATLNAKKLRQTNIAAAGRLR